MNEAYAQLKQMTKMLKNLRLWIDKGVEHAKAKSFDPETLTTLRLAPDMYTFTQQVQNACDGVKFLAARAAGAQAPKHEDSEKASIAELQGRIDSVLSFVEGFKPEQLEGFEARTITLSFLPGKGAKGQDWLEEMNLPNTYFHLCMAYAILRHNGVPIGKTEFVGNLTLHDV